jgi:hypothetical protein
VVFSGAATDLWVSSGAESAGYFAAYVELDVGVTHQQLLRIRVNRDEFNASKTGLDHSVDCVDTTATDTDDLDYC